LAPTEASPASTPLSTAAPPDPSNIEPLPPAPPLPVVLDVNVVVPVVE